MSTTTVENTVDILAANHCQRVATWTRELAEARKLSPLRQALLRQAALDHHLEPGWVQPTRKDRLVEILNERMSPRDAEEELLVGVLATAHHFDDAVGSAVSVTPQLEDLVVNAGADPRVREVVDAVRKTSRQDLRGLIPGLPVYPLAAQQVLAYMTTEDVSLVKAASLAGQDPVLAGSVVKAASSALVTTRRPIHHLVDAIAAMGIERTLDILLASALKPLVAVYHHDAQWHHALEAAQLAEAVARRTGVSPDPKLAFLAGLLHDTGMLLLWLAPETAQAGRKRLLDGGCSPVLSELLVFGASHAQTGADVLRAWSVPEECTEAVLYHHEPERTDSRLAAILYLVEARLSPQEEPISPERFHIALRRLGMSESQFDAVFPTPLFLE